MLSLSSVEFVCAWKSGSDCSAGVDTGEEVNNDGVVFAVSELSFFCCLLSFIVESAGFDDVRLKPEKGVEDFAVVAG